jgi:hypothetical protein
MTSNSDSRGLSDIVFTAADSEAARRSAAGARELSGEEYLRFLEQASANLELSRATSAGWSPFQLDDEPR